MKPTIVSDIDDTITMTNFPTPWMAPNPCMQQYLTQAHQQGSPIFYVTARPTDLYGMTLGWLRKHQFPDTDHLFIGVLPEAPRWEKLKELCQHKTCIFIDNNLHTLAYANTHIKEIPRIKILNPNQCPIFNK